MDMKKREQAKRLTGMHACLTEPAEQVCELLINTLLAIDVGYADSEKRGERSVTQRIGLQWEKLHGGFRVRERFMNRVITAVSKAQGRDFKVGMYDGKDGIELLEDAILTLGAKAARKGLVGLEVMTAHELHQARYAIDAELSKLHAL